MKRVVITLAVLLAVVASATASAIIPQPKMVTKHDNAFVILPSTTLVCEEVGLAPLVDYIRQYLDMQYVAVEAPNRNFISISLDNSMAEEAYRLSVSRESVRITAGGYGGAFNGVQTLFQLLPSEVYTKRMSLPAIVRGYDVTDRPKYAYRGFLLDVARTFMTKENVLRYVDYLAYHKINKLHWHLTDNQGWRVEIKSHPRLAEVGGFRGGDSPVKASLGKWEEKYGGYYTQEEIKEVVAYAAVRNIEIIPEIDLPGHSGALASIYPEVLCKNEDGSARESGIVVCATKESNYKLLEEILAEVCALFPSKHFHVGGDEVNMSQWKMCPDCSAWLKRRGYTDGYKLEDMFISRIQAILAKYGKSPSVWNEAAFGGGLSKEAWVHGWKSSKVCKQVMKEGYPTIFMPQEFFYFDMRQSQREIGPVWGGAFDVRKTYSFDFAKQGFSPEEISLVEGFEAAYWSESFLWQGGDKSLDFIEYQTFPRLCALAEHGWGKNGSGEWEEFHHRLHSRHYDRMADMGLNFRITPPTVKYKDGLLSVEKIDECPIYYCDDSTGEVCHYRGAIRTNKPAKYIFWAEYRGAKSPEVAHSSHYKTIQPKVTLTSSIPCEDAHGYDRVSEYYQHMRTTRTCHKGDWFLFEFEEPVECRAIEFLVRNYSSPSRLITKGYLEVSEDGVNFERIADLDYGEVKLRNPRPIKAARIVSEANSSGSHIRIAAPMIYPKY